MDKSELLQKINTEGLVSNFDSLKGSLWSDFNFKSVSLAEAANPQPLADVLTKEFPDVQINSPKASDVENGLRLAFSLPCEQLPTELAWILGIKKGTNLGLSGSLELWNGVPAIYVKSNTPITFSVLGLELPITLEMVAIPDGEDGSVTSFGRILSIYQTQLKSKPVSIPFEARFFQKHFLFLNLLATIEPAQHIGLEDISKLLSIKGMETFFPHQIPSLDSLAIEQVALTLKLDTKKVWNASILLSVKEKWDIIPSIAELTNFQIRISATDPLGEKFININGFGDASIAGVDMSCTILLPELEFSCELKPGQTIGFHAFLKSLLSIKVDMPDFTISALTLNGNIKEGSFSCYGKVKEDWSFKLGSKILELTNVNFYLAHDTSGNSIQLESDWLLGEIKLLLKLSYSSGSWAMSASCYGEIPMSKLANPLAELFGISLPPSLPKSSLTSLILDFSTSDKKISLKGTMAYSQSIDLKFQKLGLELSLLELSHTGGQSPKTTIKTSGTTSFMGAKLFFDMELPGSLTAKGTISEVDFKAILQELIGDHEPFTTLFNQGFSLDLKDIQVCVQKSAENVKTTLACEVPDYGVLLLAMESQPSGLAVAFALPDTWKLSNLPSFPKDLDKISFTNSSLILSTLDDSTFHFPDPKSLFTQPALQDVKINTENGLSKGIEFNSTIGLGDKLFEGIVSWLKLSSDLTLSTFVRIGYDPFLAELGAQIPTKNGYLEVGGLQLLNPQIQIGVGASPYFGVGASMEMPIQGQTILVNGNIEIEANGAQLETDYVGTLKWDKAFGIRTTISVTNPAVIVGFSFQGLPTLGLSGDFQIGDLSGDLAFLIDSINPINSMVSGSIEEIKLDGLVETFCQDGVKIAEETKHVLSESNISGVTLYIVPTTTKIGPNSYKSGFKFSGTLNTMGLSASTTIELDPLKGLDWKGSVDQSFKIGKHLVISSADGTTGPFFEVCTFIDNPKLVISGEAQVGDLFAALTDVKMSGESCSFLIEADIHSYFHFKIDAQNIGIAQLSDFECSLDLKMDGDHIADAIAQAKRSIQASASKSKGNNADFKKTLDNANSALDSLYSSITKGLNDQIKKKTDQISKNNTSIKALEKKTSKNGHYVTKVVRAGYVKNWKWIPAKTKKIWKTYAWISVAKAGLVQDNKNLSTQIKNLKNEINLVKTTSKFLSPLTASAVQKAKADVVAAQNAYNQAKAAVDKSLSAANNWISKNSAELIQIHKVNIATHLGTITDFSFDADVSCTFLGNKDVEFKVELDTKKIDHFMTDLVDELVSQVKTLFK